MAKKLYVGNLTYETTDSDLQNLFGPFGTVQSAQVIMDRDTGRSRGFGFVEMDSADQAQAAINGLHDKETNGRRLDARVQATFLKLGPDKPSVLATRHVIDSTL